MLQFKNVFKFDWKAFELSVKSLKPHKPVLRLREN